MQRGRGAGGAPCVADLVAVVRDTFTEGSHSDHGTDRPPAPRRTGQRSAPLPGVTVGHRQPQPQPQPPNASGMDAAKERRGE